MNLFNYNDKPEDLHRHKDQDTHVVSFFWDKYKHDPDELKKRENAIARSTVDAFNYASKVLHKAFPKGESAIAKDPVFARWYANQVLKGPFPKGEATIATDAIESYFYALDSLKGPFPKGEATIAKSNKRYEYIRAFPEKKKQ